MPLAVPNAAIACVNCLIVLVVSSPGNSSGNPGNPDPGVFIPGNPGTVITIMTASYLRLPDLRISGSGGDGPL